MMMHLASATRSLLPVLLLSLLAALPLSGCRKQQVAGMAQGSRVLATIPPNDAPPDKGARYANQAPRGAIVTYLFSENGGGVAYSVRDYGYAYVAFNGRPGKVYQADVGEPVLSPDGRRVAFGAPVADGWRMVVDGVEGASFEQVWDPRFSPDGRHLAYCAAQQGRWGVVVDGTWHAGNSTQHGDHLFSADSSRIAFLDRLDGKEEGRLVLSDLSFRQQQILLPAGVSRLVGNGAKTHFAAVVSEGGSKRVITFGFADPGQKGAGPAYDSIGNLAFAPDGASVAYTAGKGGESYLVLDDREEILGHVSLQELPVVRPDLKGAGGIIAVQDRFFLRQFFLQDEGAEKGDDEAAFLTYSKDSIPAFAARKGERWMVVAGGKEGPLFDRVVTPRFSPDGRYLVYRARKDGKRFVVVADAAARTVRLHPAYEQVFDLSFSADGKSVCYGVKDGRQLVWKVEKL